MLTDSHSRPWGFYRVLSVGAGWWVKLLVINPRQRLSLQSHEGRDEDWTVIQGEGIAEIVGKGRFVLSRGHSVYIRHGERHRLTNLWGWTMTVVEVATGDCREEDIVRYDDDYGRVYQ